MRCVHAFGLVAACLATAAAAMAAGSVTLAAGSKTDSAGHTKAVASYSLVQVGSVVRLNIGYSTTSAQSRGGGRGLFHVGVFDSRGNLVLSRSYSNTIDRSPSKGDLTKSGKDTVEIYGGAAAAIMGMGGYVVLAIGIDRENRSIPRNASELKALYKSLGGAEFGSKRDLDTKGLLIRAFSGSSS